MNKQMLEKLKNKKILVLGFARSGYKTAKILAGLKLDVTLNANEDLSNNEQAIELANLGVKIVDGGHPVELLENIDLIIKNPGIPYKIEFLQEALKRKIKIITEVELANTLYENNIIAITGTNGKTTTTTLMYEMFKVEKPNVQLAGNIGFPAIEVADNNKDNNPIIMEISSFQLNGTENFKPKIAIITNLGEGHLDYHGSVEEYHNVKKRIFKNQTKEDYLILNIEDKDNYNLAEIQSTIIFYSTKENEKADAYIKNGWLIYNDKEMFEVAKVSLPGEHNLENCINAAIASLLQGVSIEAIREVAYSFSGVKHRLQYVGEFNGVKYYNDSKATNPVSTTKALSGFEKNVILICGGTDRGVKFLELEEYTDRIKNFVCVGESKEILVELAERNNISAHRAIKISDATEIAAKLAVCGDVILLSPACASWDQYPSFEVRGQEFIDTFEKIKSEELIINE